MATNLTTLFKNIADAIRAKSGESAPIVAENFPAEIAKLSSGYYITNSYAEGERQKTIAELIGKSKITMWNTTESALTDKTVIGLGITSSDATKYGIYYYDQASNSIKGDLSNFGTFDSETGTITVPSPYKFANRYTYMGF